MTLIWVSMYFLQTETHVCLCACFVDLSVYSCGCVHVWEWVRNAWPCWEEWLLYSWFVGAMGAGAVSLGSCMDGLRRSPSFIKHTPTCRIDLAKKQGGNSSSSVFPNHKSLRGVPPRGKVTPLSVQRSPPTTEGAGQELLLIWWPQSVQWEGNSVHANDPQQTICTKINTKEKTNTRTLADNAAKSSHKNK